MDIQTPDPEQLVKSRYTAYAVGNANYIVHTTHPKGYHFQDNLDQWKSDILRFSKVTQFNGLEILSQKAGEEEFWVTFHVNLSQYDKDASFTEKSRFKKEDDRWLYFDGELDAPTST